MLVNITFDPIIAQLGPVQLGWHGIFTALAVVVAIRIGLRGAATRGLPGESFGRVATWAIVGGLVGARLFHVLDHLSYYLARPSEALAVYDGGTAVYGAFLGGIGAGLLAARRAGLPAWPLLDVAAPAMLVGQAIGRLGCLSNGDAWGRSTGGAWGVVYWHPHDLLPPALLGVPTHPYPLYEIAAVALLLAALRFAGGWPRAVDGGPFLAAAAGYSVIRFGLTFLRQGPALLWGLQEAQVVASATGIAALGVLLVRRCGGRRPRLSVATPAGGGHRA